MKNSIRNKFGATMIEIVIAVFILAIAFFPILRVVDVGSVNTATGLKASER